MKNSIATSPPWTKGQRVKIFNRDTQNKVFFEGVAILVSPCVEFETGDEWMVRFPDGAIVRRTLVEELGIMPVPLSLSRRVK